MSVTEATDGGRPGSIEFVNHASVVISHGGVSLLSDPWYSGSAFGHGWSLLYENSEEYISNLVTRVQYIWYSHEHPDHFSIPFLRRYEHAIKERDVKILYQETQDRRVLAYLEKQGFEVTTLRDGDEFRLSNEFSVRLERVGADDSALICDVGNTRILNINDCTLDEHISLRRFKKRYGTCDILLTQFGYAAWRRTASWRKTAAGKKLKTIALQDRYLEPRVIIPFASFVYFSNPLNRLMNDQLNSPERVIRGLSHLRDKLRFMAPEEVRYFDNLPNDADAMQFWAKRFGAVNELPRTPFPKSVSAHELRDDYEQFVAKISANNNVFLMRLLSLLPLFGFFAKLNIFLVDLNESVSFDLFGNFEDSPADDGDIRMHSFSLHQIFCDAYGFDTLTVNGCFSTRDEQSSRKLLNTLAVTKLNQLGHRVGFSLVLKFRLVFMATKTFVRAIRKNH